MTATVNVVTTAGINSANSDLYRYLANVASINFPTATDYNGVDPTDAAVLLVTGTGLTYNGNHLTGGTIGGISITIANITILTETFSPGLSALPVDTAATAYLNSGLTDHSALDLIFQVIPFTFTGNELNDNIYGARATTPSRAAQVPTIWTAARGSIPVSAGLGTTPTMCAI